MIRHNEPSYYFIMLNMTHILLNKNNVGNFSETFTNERCILFNWVTVLSNKTDIICRVRPFPWYISLLPTLWPTFMKMLFNISDLKAKSFSEQSMWVITSAGSLHASFWLYSLSLCNCTYYFATSRPYFMKNKGCFCVQLLCN